MSNNANLVKKAKDTLMTKYNMTQENLTKYLGINVKIERNPSSVSLALTKYADKLQERFNVITTEKPLQVPMTMDPNVPTGHEENLILTKARVKDYMSRVGSLMFAASTTRPDIQLACSKLAQGNKKPNSLHEDQVRRSLRYICDTKALSLTYTHDAPYGDELMGFSDANYNRDGCSQTGYIFLLCGSAISWASKKQTCPTLSST
jgi:hypothetical protein